jgi:hypothetical protein
MQVRKLSKLANAFTSSSQEVVALASFFVFSNATRGVPHHHCRSLRFSGFFFHYFTKSVNLHGKRIFTLAGKKKDSGNQQSKGVFGLKFRGVMSKRILSFRSIK